MRPLKSDDLVRGQYAGYRKEPGVAKDSDVETFCALRLFIDSWRWEGVPWYLRFRLSPRSAIALAARVKRTGEEFIGDQQELYLIEEFQGERAPYERLLGDAMAGDRALFTREDAVEAAWTVVDPVLKTHLRVRPYKRHSWGPKEADVLIATDGGWHNPRVDKRNKPHLGGIGVWNFR
jgi:glucose-6-phosphate 1-dehydrogenase